MSLTDRFNFIDNHHVQVPEWNNSVMSVVPQGHISHSEDFIATDGLASCLGIIVYFTIEGKQQCILSHQHVGIMRPYPNKYDAITELMEIASNNGTTVKPEYDLQGIEAVNDYVCYYISIVLNDRSLLQAIINQVCIVGPYGSDDTFGMITAAASVAVNVSRQMCIVQYKFFNIPPEYVFHSQTLIFDQDDRLDVFEDYDIEAIKYMMKILVATDQDTIESFGKTLLRLEAAVDDNRVIHHRSTIISEYLNLLYGEIEIMFNNAPSRTISDDMNGTGQSTMK
ncbi:unnamed protein product [Didymodactylos carnosus]|uniref:Uncharacterized protein n=2 Tax=Didymodactylos carnosus TaxID=1234261 RepID=A0A8S2JYA0_9BILA|nr:unnamed protein product [Didymodactylos carnosus]CAF3831124.1 unnamed protein product [Didymodactylos carnosus]